jgi:hypothetical protein
VFAQTLSLQGIVDLLFESFHLVDDSVRWHTVVAASVVLPCDYG